MIRYPIEHYVARREECLAEAASTKLENSRKRHLDAAEAWQDIIDQLQSGRHTSRVRGEFPKSAGQGSAG